jgi:hypothetical protein
LVEQFGGAAVWGVSVCGLGEAEGGGVCEALQGVLSGIAGVLRVEAAACGGGWVDASVCFDREVEDAGERIGRVVADVGGVVRRLERRRATLEEVYTRLVMGAAGAVPGGGELPNGDPSEKDGPGGRAA